jgi:hypothetical protein
MSVIGARQPANKIELPVLAEEATVLASVDAYRPWRHGVGRECVLKLTGPVA